MNCSQLRAPATRTTSSVYFRRSDGRYAQCLGRSWLATAGH